MIEMPLNRPTESAAASSATNESAAEAPEGAFEEMLARNLGRGIVRRTSAHSQESEQDAAQGGAHSGTQFFQGAPVIPWTPTKEVPSETALPGPVSDSAAPVVAAVTNEIATRAPAAATSQNSVPVVGTAPTATAATTAAALGAILERGVGESTRALDNPWGGTARSDRVAPTDLIGGPSSESGVLDSPRLETTAATAPRIAVGPDVGATAPSATQAGSAVPPGNLPGGTIQTGTIQTGTAQTGTAQTGTAQTGTAQTGTVQSTTPQGLEATAATTTAAATAVDLRNADQAPELSSSEVRAAEATEGAAATLQGPQPTRPVAAPNARLVNRVIRMVEYQQTQPPPRMVVVDMPELGGLRLMVALQNDGKVHVAPIAGSAPQQVAAPFMQAVGEALFAEGFDLAEGSQEQEPRDRQVPDEPAPTSRRSGRRRRSGGLRL